MNNYVITQLEQNWCLGINCHSSLINGKKSPGGKNERATVLMVSEPNISGNA